jgi:hypothetical protein
MFCGNCGTQLPDDAQFCGNCGTKTGGISVNVPSSPPVYNQTAYSPPPPPVYNQTANVPPPPPVYNQTEEKEVTYANADGRSSYDKYTDKAKKKHAFIFGILIIVAIIFGICYFVTASSGKNTSSATANGQQRIQNNTGSTTAQQPQASSNNIKPQSSSGNIQPQSNSGNIQQTTPSNTETLTYYINGNAKTANVVFLGYMEKRFSLDAGGNIVMYVRFQDVEGNWTGWEFEEILKKQDGSINGVADIAFGINEISFYNAIEETIDGMQLILIWQKIDDLLFGTTKVFFAEDYDNECVYTLQKVYERK